MKLLTLNNLQEFPANYSCLPLVTALLLCEVGETAQQSITINMKDKSARREKRGMFQAGTVTSP